MKISNINYQIILNDKDGSIESLKIYGKEIIQSVSPIFTIRLRNKNGAYIDVPTSSNGFKIKKEEEIIEMFFKMNNLGSVIVEIQFPKQEPLSYWKIKKIDHDPDWLIEWIEFPSIIIKNDLIKNGGKSRLLWPGMEGVLIEDINIREKNKWLKYKPLGYPNRGWEGYFPGPVQLQFMAYYDDESGFYIGAHDKNDNTKEIEFHEEKNGIKLEFRVFPGTNDEIYSMDYNMVLGTFKGDWHDAAEIYRKWFINSYSNKKREIPQWIDDSPIVVIYPVRGTKDTGNMIPNSEYFPYKNGIKHIDKFSKLFDSKILDLLMHWEGTAPWAPPYVWPPFGGENIFKEFVDEMHKNGHLIGVYCSGLGWTNESLLIPDYKMNTVFEKLQLAKIMCVGPKGEMKSLICNGTQRWGYDMCISTNFTRETALNELIKIAKSGVDYIQFFDQNLGGASYFCYSKEHNHPPIPGKWQIEYMKDLLHKMNETIKNENVIIGCEAAAAEPFITELKFNDLRFNINFFLGEPVPVYNYIFHEFVANFMGNQNSSTQSIDINRSPNNLLYRIAYSFTYGDILTIVLRDNGTINWDWGTDWNIDPPEQNSVITLIKNLNFIRKTNAKPYLTKGKMLKPDKLEYIDKFEKLYMKNGESLEIPPLLVSKWISNGKTAEIITNYTIREQEFSIDINQKISRISDSFGNIYVDDKKFFKIKPLSTILIEFEN